MTLFDATRLFRGTTFATAGLAVGLSLAAPAVSSANPAPVESVMVDGVEYELVWALDGGPDVDGVPTVSAALVPVEFDGGWDGEEVPVKGPGDAVVLPTVRHIGQGLLEVSVIDQGQVVGVTVAFAPLGVAVDGQPPFDVPEDAAAAVASVLGLSPVEVAGTVAALDGVTAPGPWPALAGMLSTL